VKTKLSSFTALDIHCSWRCWRSLLLTFTARDIHCSWHSLLLTFIALDTHCSWHSLPTTSTARDIHCSCDIQCSCDIHFSWDIHCPCGIHCPGHPLLCDIHCTSIAIRNTEVRLSNFLWQKISIYIYLFMYIYIYVCAYLFKSMNTCALFCDRGMRVALLKKYNQSGLRVSSAKFRTCGTWL